MILSEFHEVVSKCGDMSEILPSAVLHQQVPADEIRQTRTMLQAIMPAYRAAWLKFGFCEEIAHLLNGSVVLQGQTH